MADLSKRAQALSASKQALLHQLLLEKSRRAAQTSAIPRRGAGDAWPLSFAQERLWFLDQLSPDSALYNEPVALQLTGELDLSRLQRCFEAIIRRHELLRTTFPTRDGVPVQVVAAGLRAQLRVVDLQALPAERRAAAAEQLALQEIRRPFALARGPLLRTLVLRLAAQAHTLLINMHHIISDGWSVGILLRELTTLYAADAQPAALPELPIQYADYAVWQRAWLEDARRDQQLAYWKNQLAGAPTVLDLPTDHPRPPQQTFRGERQTLQLSASLTADLNALSQHEGATLFMTVLTGFAALLARYSGQDDLLLGTRSAGRSYAATEPLIGLFLNVLVLRADLTGAPSFRTLLARLRTTALDAYAHQDLPFEQLVRALQPERDLSQQPLFQVMCVLQNAPLPSVALPELTMRPLKLSGQTARYDLDLSLSEKPEGLRGTLDYNCDLFDAHRIARLLRHLQQLLAAATAAPDQPISALPLLSAAERQQLLHDWLDTSAPYPAEASLIGLFNAQAARTPDAVALACAEQQLSYRALASQVDALAALLRAHGAGPERLVGVCLERSLATPLALLAILSAGGCYVPLDPAYPDALLCGIIADTRLALLLTTTRLAARLPRVAQVLCLDALPPTSAALPAHAPAAHADQAFAIMYTSGSTGRPKGVVLPQRQLLNRCAWTWQRLPFAPDEVAAQRTGLPFTPALPELLAPLLVGIRMVVLPDALVAEPSALLATLWAQRITRLVLVPTLLALLLDQGDAALEALGGLRLCSVGGEALAPALLARVRAQLPQLRLLNQYGASEVNDAVVYDTRALSAAATSVPLGRPITNMRAYVLDRQHQLLPLGIAGELHLASVGLARGYFARPDLTAERFIPNPFAEDTETRRQADTETSRHNYPQSAICNLQSAIGTRLYRTGDIARWRVDGTLEYLGRRDAQVKLRGVRVELAGIEALLREHSAVAAAAVALYEDVPGHARLVAYVVTTKDERRKTKGEESDPSIVHRPSSIVDDLRSFLTDQLPSALVPTTFVLLDALPLTPNGKLNRRALPAPANVDVQDAAFVAARTPTEQVLAAIWQQLLGIERVGVTDNFFALGGHSLLATQVVARLREAFQVELPLRVLFEAPTLAALAEQITRAHQPGPAAPPIRPAARDGELPLSFAQQRLWFLSQLEPASAFYNVPATLRLSGTLDVPALRRSLALIVERHEVLRTTFAAPDGQPVQIISASRQDTPSTAARIREGTRRSAKAESSFAPLGAASRIETTNDDSAFAPLGAPSWIASVGLLPLLDLRGLPQTLREATALRLASAEALRPFDLTSGPLLRATLLRLEEHEQIILLTLHHIVSDGWSTRVLVRELATLYNACANDQPSPLPALPIQYADYAIWQRQWLQGDVLDQQLAYWRAQLTDLPLLDLPLDRPRAATERFAGARQALALPRELTDALKALSRQSGVTLFMTMLAAFQLLLARWSGQDDIAVGAPIAGRVRAETEPLIGFFVNTLVLRTSLAGDPSFVELLRRVRETALQAYAHQDLPFERLVEALQPQRDRRHNPFFDVLFNYLDSSPLKLDLPGLTLRPLQTEPTSRFPITLYVDEVGDDLSLRLVYQRARFSAERIASLLSQYQQLLIQIVAAPQQPIGGYSLVTPDTRELLPDPAAPLRAPEYELVTSMVLGWAARLPQQAALRQDEHTLSYASLAQAAADLAGVLLARGLARGEVVAVCGPRSCGLIVGMLAVWMSGGVLLPIDRSLPQQRQRIMLNQAKAAFVLYVIQGSGSEDTETRRHGDTQNSNVSWSAPRPPNPDPRSLSSELRAEDQWLHTQPATLIAIDLLGQPIGMADQTNADSTQLPELSPHDPAYIFFTSGTTGVPKGVLGWHKGLSHFLVWQRETFGIGPHDRAAQLTGLSFNVLLRDVFTPLTSGATLCLPPLRDEFIPDRVLSWLEREQITLIHTVPTLAQSWLAQPPPGVSLRALRWIFSAGEPLTAALVERWRAMFPESPGRFVLLYGQTETTLAKCFYPIPDEIEPGVQPVGQPLPHTQALVLTPAGQLCGLGEPGEVVIRTPYRSLGYINAPDEQRKRFVRNPLSTDEHDLLYYTGDRGRYRLDGSLALLGRSDDQIKIRGMRVEPDEVQSWLARHPALRAAVVVVREDAHPKGGAAEKRLVAYVVPIEDEGRRTNDEGRDTLSCVSTRDLRAFLQQHLPDYMIPSAFVLLDALPLTPNGKLDRRALPAPEPPQDDPAQPFVAPRTPVEATLAQIWSTILGLERVGIHDNFFALGGHSLLATQVAARMRSAFQIDIPVRSMFEATTIAELAELVERAQGSLSAHKLPTITRRSREQHRGIVNAQQVQTLPEALKRDLTREEPTAET